MVEDNGGLTSVLGEAAGAAGLSLVGHQLLPDASHSLLRVYVETRQGQSPSVDQIAQANRQISAMLDVHQVFTGRFTLEVSSPGLDRLLFSLDDCRRFVGCQVQGLLKESVCDQRRFKALLERVDADQLFLQLQSGDQLMVKFGELRWIRLVPENPFTVKRPCNTKGEKNER